MGFTSGVATHDRRAWVDVNGNRHSTYLAQLRKGQTIEQYYRKRGARYDPRPEFDNHNPILEAVRAEVEATWAGDIPEFLRWSIFPDGTPYSYLALYPEQIDHARRVLTKLAALA